MAVYKIIFKGEITNEGNRSKIEAALAKFFKIPTEKASILFNGKSYALKKGLEVDDAIATQQKFSVIGVVTHLVKEEVVIENITTQEPVDSIQDKEKKPVENNIIDRKESETSNKVDDEWRDKFALVVRIEQGDMPEGFVEKAKLYAKNFNVWAGVFGVFYLLYKRMWAVALLYVSCVIFLDSFVYVKFELLGAKAQPEIFTYLMVGLFIGHYCNRLYFYSVNQNENWVSKLLNNTKALVGVLLVSVLVNFLTLYQTFSYDDASGVWYSERMNQEITIDLASKKRTITLGDSKQYLVKNVKTSISGNYLTISTITVSGDGKQVPREWIIKKEPDGLIEFFISIEVFGEVLDDIEWVREI